MTESPQPAKVYICYRRSDTERLALTLHGNLERTFGAGTAFLDTRTIEHGVEWPAELQRQLEGAAAIVVLIGKNWLSAQDKFFRRRIDDPGDWVHREIAHALSRQEVDPSFHIYPVLRLPADWPEPEAFPEPLAAICKRQKRSYDGDDPETFFREFHQKLVRDLGLTKVPVSTQPSRTGFAGYEDVYAASVREAHGFLPMIGFPRTVRAPIRLDELYIELEARPASSDTEEFRRGRGSAPVRLADVFPHAWRTGERRGIVLLGHPGAGKTTHLRRIALGVVSPSFGPPALGLDQRTLPVFLPLRRLDAGDLETRGEALLARTSDTPLDQATSLLHGHEQLLLLFDGLDEVPASLRVKTSAWIRELGRQLPDARIAVTCRIAGYSKDARLGNGFAEFEIEPLSDALIAEFVRNWYREVGTQESEPGESPENRDAAADLIERLRSGSIAAIRVAEMAANPLLLTIICLVHRDRGRLLPDARTELYEACLDSLLDLWRKHWKHEQGRISSYDRNQALRVLQPLALSMHEAGKTRLAAADLEEVLAPALERVKSKLTPSEFLEEVRDDSGVLTGYSGDVFGFMHLGFQEYLAARQIHMEFCKARIFGRPSDRLQRLAEFFGEDRWQEVILLLLATGEVSLFGPFFEEVVKTAQFAAHPSLVEQCLKEATEVDAEPFRAALESTSEGTREAARRALQMLGEAAPETYEAAATITIGGPGIRQPIRALHTRVHESTGIVLVRIPASSFQMGGNARDREQPIHEVHVPAFWIARTPVTNEQYRRFCAATGHEVPRSFKERTLNAPNQPVVYVSWRDATAFCEWAGLQLPSEAMWEYACRAGTTMDYWSGNETADLARVGWFDENSAGRLQQVGQKPANAFGLYDVHGNVWEWCQDNWHGDYEGAPADSTAWEGGGSPDRVVRGGSFESGARRCRSAYRLGGHPSYGVADLGFRPASLATQ